MKKATISRRPIVALLRNGIRDKTIIRILLYQIRAETSKHKKDPIKKEKLTFLTA